jgi:hypothetical protein
MLIDSQPGWIEFLPAWSASLPSGKLEGALLRGQILVKEMAWDKDKISAVLYSNKKQWVELKKIHHIQNITGSKSVKIKQQKNKINLLLPKKLLVNIQVTR